MTMLSVLLTSTLNILYSLVMLQADKQVKDIRRTSHAQTGTVFVPDGFAEMLISPRNFAENVGIKFHTPEEFFLGEAPRPFTRTFEPSGYLTSASAATGERLIQLLKL